jgi:hypothetical protein
MFPALPKLPDLSTFATGRGTFHPQLQVIGPGGGGGGGFDLGGILGGGGGSGGSGSSGAPKSVLDCTMKSKTLDEYNACVTALGKSTFGPQGFLGLPAINWGRIAAFLLGLLLIGGGLYLIKPIQQVVNVTTKRAGEMMAA